MGYAGYLKLIIKIYYKMKYKLLEKVPRKCFADHCEIVEQGDKKYLKISVSGGRGLHNRIFAEGKDILCKENIYCCFQNNGICTLCYYDAEKRQIMIVCKQCFTYFFKNTSLFFKKKSIWYCFDLQLQKYLRLGVLREEGFWMPPRDRLKGCCSSVHVYFFYNGEFVKKHCERVVKALGNSLYFMKIGKTVSVLTDFCMNGQVPTVGKYISDIPVEKVGLFFSTKGIYKKLFY